ncbi:CU044_2847 family protein [Sinomonas sp. B1-1]|uniref:CU044_2847 family protein n=1 Tax=Sinomonas sp. B1-1 TaxID=3141454 RepID=UPI003D269E68
MVEMNILVPVEIDGVRFFVDARNDSGEPAPEGPIGAPKAESIDKALEGIGVAVQRTVTELNGLKWSKLTVEVGVEFMVGSSGLAAVLCKAGAGSSLKVSLEFDRSDK